ncbi:hypothetical protein [Enterococcus avium]|nr:hypothetical protein [Enterococcus avium]
MGEKQPDKVTIYVTRELKSMEDLKAILSTASILEKIEKPFEDCHNP